MNSFLLWSHPVIQIIAMLIGIFAIVQGAKRFAMQHGKKCLFPWKQHVKLGSAALILWIFGATGFYVTHTVFEVTHITGIHAYLAWVIVILSVFGLISGYVMNKIKKRRKVLPAVHGAANVILLILILIECYKGIWLMRDFLFD